MTNPQRIQVIHFPDGTEDRRVVDKLLEVNDSIDWKGSLAQVVKVEDDDAANERHVWVD
jgi:hypothetical protein